MWLKMKNVNIMGFRQFLGENWGAVGGGGGSQKTIYMGNCLKRGTWTICKKLDKK